AFPSATLSTLEHVIANATIDELRAARRSRRDLVWALEQLLWPVQTFEGAAHLMLKLAAAENESWTNNATGIWVETFQTLLGRTAAGWPRRVSVVQTAATSTLPAERVLAAKAIGAAFRTRHVIRMGNPPSDVLGMPEQSWRPKTYSEWWDSLDAYLGILKALLTDDAPEVRTTAAQVLGEISGELFALAGERVSKTWAEVAASLAGASYELRGPIIGRIEEACDLWEYRLTNSHGNREELAQEAEEGIRAILARLGGVKTVLQGADFQSRFRTVLSRSPHRMGTGEDLDTNERRIRDEMRPLAREAIGKPSLLDDEWGFLMAEKAWWQPERWCEVLGEEDAGAVFRPTIEQLSTTTVRAVTWLSLYEIGRRRAGHADVQIDRRVEQLIERQMAAQAFDLLLRTGYDASRVIVMKRIFGERLVPPADVNRLGYSDWALHLEPLDALELAQEALSAAQCAEDVVPFVESYLHSHGEAVAQFRGTALRILTSAPKPLEERSNGRSYYEWETLAKRYAPEAPDVIGAAALDRVVAQSGLPDSGLIEVIQRAWEASEKQSFFEAVVAPRMLGETVGAWRVRNAAEQLPITEVGVDVLVRWVDEDPERRARLLAHIAGAPHPPMSELHATLLQRYSRFGVGGIFQGNFESGSWSGPMSGWLKSKIAAAEQLSQDERQVVRQWAEDLMAGLREQLASAEAREAEERIERS
ncbi:MAG TPA: hypothetical protein VJU82_17235, partial [Acidobacteriaceae bacterium]|nr:hypothetical protein [Acidobacteriaceae bacterium]